MTDETTSPPADERTPSSSVERQLAQRRWVWLFFSLLIIGFPTAALLMQRPPSLENLGPVPEFSLVDQREVQVSPSDLEGAIVVVDFIFTRCPDVCPLLSEKMAALQDRLGETGGKQAVRYLSISVDPDYDTPSVLAEYGARYDADPNRWHLLTGEREAIDEVLAGFMTALIREAGDDDVPNIRHSQRFVLVDAEGTIRRYYKTDAEGLKELERAIRYLLRA